MSSRPYDTDRFGAALPRFSPRQADLLMVVGTVTHKQAPVLLKVYEQMCEPKWVMAFGVCATSRRLLPELRGGARHRQDHPGRRLRPRLPAAPRDGDRRHHAAAGQDRRARGIRSSPRTSDRGRRDPRPRCSSAWRRPPATTSFAHGIAGGRARRPRRCSRPSRAAASAEFGFDLFLDVTAVDWPRQTPRFEVVYHFYSTQHFVRVRLKTRVPEAGPDRRFAGPAVRLGPLHGARVPRHVRDRASAATPTCARSCSTRASSATRCARTTRRSSEQPLVPYRK